MFEIKLLDDGYIGEVFVPVLAGYAKKATKYISPKLVVKATLHGRKIDRRTGSFSILVTLGVPNYAEREYIKLLKAAGELFPVKKIQLKPIHKEDLDGEYL